MPNLKNTLEILIADKKILKWIFYVIYSTRFISNNNRNYNIIKTKNYNKI